MRIPEMSGKDRKGALRIVGSILIACVAIFVAAIVLAELKPQPPPQISRPGSCAGYLNHGKVDEIFRVTIEVEDGRTARAAAQEAMDKILQDCGNAFWGYRVAVNGPRPGPDLVRRFGTLEVDIDGPTEWRPGR